MQSVYPTQDTSRMGGREEESDISIIAREYSNKSGQGLASAENQPIEPSIDASPHTMD